MSRIGPEVRGRGLTSVTTNGVFGIELVGYVAMVFSRMAFADCGFHQTRQRGEDVDGWVDALVVQLTVNEYLALGDVSC